MAQEAGKAMNRIIREHYPAARLPDDLEVAIKLNTFVVANIETLS